MAIINNQKIIKGATIIEILIVIFIIVVALIGIFNLINLSLNASNLIKETTLANSLAQETMEAVRNFRDGTNWNSDGLGIILVNTNYFPQKSGTPPKWQLVQGTETINNFTTKVIFNEVLRDGNKNIVESGGTNDPNTRKATVTVSWKNKEVKITTYFTNWR